MLGIQQTGFLREIAANLYSVCTRIPVLGPKCAKVENGPCVSVKVPCGFISISSRNCTRHRITLSLPYENIVLWLTIKGVQKLASSVGERLQYCGEIPKKSLFGEYNMRLHKIKYSGMGKLWTILYFPTRLTAKHVTSLNRRASCGESKVSPITSSVPSACKRELLLLPPNSRFRRFSFA